MRSRQQQGFSLLEILIVMGIMGIISAGILSQMDSAQQRGYSEQVKLDNFQEARDFVDQFFRDINQIGYPNSRKVNGSGSCILCLQRSEADKVSADTLNGQNLNWGTEANDVITSPIFSYFKADGTQIPDASLPYNISTSTGATALASVKTIKISLTIRNNAVIDPKTNQPIETNFEGEVSINNCSMATIGSPQSCQ